MDFSHPLYVRSPVWLQNTMISARGFARKSLRAGAAFQRELDEVLRAERLSAQESQVLQLQRLQRVLRHAAEHVPHYRDSFAAAGFDPADFHSLDDIHKVPILTKQDVRDAGSRMHAEVSTGPRVAARTSGTTGTSLRLVRDLHSINREHAFIWRHCIGAGGNPGDRYVSIRGDKIVPVGTTRPPFWRYSVTENLMHMSAYHLSEDTAEDYLRALEAFDPVFGMTYPSVLMLLSRYMLDAGRPYRGKRLRSFVTSSENFSPEQRALVERAFDCKTFDQYGSAERVVFIGTCESGNYHVNTDYAFTEFHPTEDGTFEVVGTSFDNLAMPWIRYRLGDSIVPADAGYECPCGRAWPVVERIGGRIEDYILAPDGRKLFMLSNLLDEIPDLLEGQIRQESPDEVAILIVPVAGKTLDSATIERLARSYLGDSFPFRVEQVESIPRTANGKHRAVVRTFK